MPVVPTYESRVTLNPTPVKESQFVDTSKMFPNTAPDFTKISAAAMAYQKRIDKSRALEAKNAMLQYVYENTYGENGYLRKQGKAALDPDENGEGLVQRSLTNFDKYKDEYLSKNRLTSAQMQLLNEDLMTVRRQYQAGIGAHVLKEQNTYDDQNIEVAINNHVRLAVETGGNINAVSAQLKGLDKTLGEARDIKQWSDGVFANKTMLARSAVVSSALSATLSMMDTDPKKAYPAAQAIFDKFSGPKYMTAEAKLKYKATLAEAELVYSGANCADAVRSKLALSNNEAAKAISLIATDKVPGELLVTVNQEGDPVQNGMRTPSGGLGFTSISQEAARQVAEADPNLAWDPKRFKSDEGYRVLLGTKYAEKLLQSCGSIEEAFARFRYGDKDVDKAIDEAKKQGDSWLNHFGEKDIVEKNANKIRRAMYKKSLVDENNNKMDPLSSKFHSHNMSTMSDDELSKLALITAPQFAKESEAHQKLVKRMKIEQAAYLADEDKKFTDGVLKVVRAINKGEKPSLEDLKSLPLPTQAQLEDLADKRRQNFLEPNTEMLEYFEQHPEEMFLEDDAKYEVLSVYFGSEAKRMAKLRAAAKYQLFSAQGRQLEAQQAAQEGNLDVRFMPSSKKLKEATAMFFKTKTYDGTNSEHRALYIRLLRYAQAKAQQRAAFTNDKDGSKGKPVNADDILMEIVDEMSTQLNNGEAIMPLAIKRSDIPNRSDTDVQETITRIAEMRIKEKYPNIPQNQRVQVTDDQWDETFGLLLAGQAFKFMPPGDIGTDSFLNRFAISKPVYEQAKRELEAKHPGSSKNGFLVLGRYVQLLCRQSTSYASSDTNAGTTLENIEGND